MKKLILTLIIVALCSRVHATDRIVNENSIPGAYTTITAALNAAVNNDRIVIAPRGGGLSYVENISSNLTGIQMLSATEGTKYKIIGNITMADGWQIYGADVIGDVYCIGNSANGERLAGCKITGRVHGIGSYNINFFIDNDSIITNQSNYGAVEIYCGRVSGCYISSPDLGIIVAQPITNNSDSVFIVGNHIVASYGMNIISQNRYSYISNNFIEISWRGILILECKAGGTGNNSCINNTIKFTGASGVEGIEFGSPFTPVAATFDLRNNIVISSSSSVGYYINPNSLIVPTFQYNYYNGPGTAFNLNGITPDATNIAASNSTINTDGTLVAGSDAIDGGDPADRYLDIGLPPTRNDAGCYGGSYSLANFTTADSGSRVLFMKAPRVILSNQSFGISGEGLDK
ncbi:MAG: hypothetical protein NTZ16_16260 [Verrucomicrobia bacterium]|nr:hypothetical protein [Verrucomicrobiota bacterium]